MYSELSHQTGALTPQGLAQLQQAQAGLSILAAGHLVSQAKNDFPNTHEANIALAMLANQSARK